MKLLLAIFALSSFITTARAEENLGNFVCPQLDMEINEDGSQNYLPVIRTSLKLSESNLTVGVTFPDDRERNDFTEHVNLADVESIGRNHRYDNDPCVVLEFDCKTGTKCYQNSKGEWKESGWFVTSPSLSEVDEVEEKISAAQMEAQ